MTGRILYTCVPCFHHTIPRRRRIARARLTKLNTADVCFSDYKLAPRIALQSTILHHEHIHRHASAYFTALLFRLRIHAAHSLITGTFLTNVTSRIDQEPASDAGPLLCANLCAVRRAGVRARERALKHGDGDDFVLRERGRGAKPHEVQARSVYFMMGRGEPTIVGTGSGGHAVCRRQEGVGRGERRG